MLEDRTSNLLIRRINELRQAFKQVIERNPVKHGYVRSPSEWQHSSIHRYINSGILPQDWASHGESDIQMFG